MKMSRFRQGLVGLLALGAVASLGAGSFATFNATVGTAGNSFEMGTLTASLSGTGNATVSSCNSYGANTTLATDASNTNNCAAVLSASNVKPGATPITETLTIANTGTIDAGTFRMYMPATQTGGVSCLAYNSASAVVPGTSDPCATGGFTFSVEMIDSASAHSCIYPAGAGACASTGTLSGFASSYNSSANGAPLACLSGTTSTSGAINHSGSCQFIVTLGAPSTLNNTYQGRGAKFDLTWYLGQ